MEEFYSVSILLGVAIGIDVAIVTCVRSRYFVKPLNALIWLFAIGSTHTVFPLLGSAISLQSLQWMPQLTAIIGLAAFLLIAWFIVDDLFSPVCNDVDKKDSSPTALLGIGLVLAVSWDALWSGPAISAYIPDWSQARVLACFLLSGFTVLSLASISLALTRLIVESSWIEQSAHPLLEPFATWLQCSAIGYFAWLALFKYTLSFSSPELYVLFWSMLVSALLLLLRSALSERNLILRSS